MSTLVYFVEDTETSFVLNDLRVIAKEYNEVILLSAETIDNKSDLPNNVKTFENFINWENLNIKKLIAFNFFKFCVLYITECIQTNRLLPIRQSLAVLASNFYKAKEVERVLKNYKDIDYSNIPMVAFWFYDCIYLARLKEVNFSNKVFSRAHGGDVFEERSSLNGKVLFRNYQLRHLNRVFSVSNTGTNYLKNKYPKYQNKIETIFLGSFNHPHLNPFKKDEFTIVTCAKIRDVKRIHLLAEALQFIDISCKWYHLGDENLSAANDHTIPMYIKAKEALKQKSNIEFIALGNLQNQQIYDFYAKTPISLFVSVSASEGIPVSMMEAISYGIPIVSTDVGGCREIVTEKTGILIPEYSSPKNIAQSIQSFYQSDKNSTEFREQVRQFWQTNFDMKSNYNRLFDVLKQVV